MHVNVDKNYFEVYFGVYLGHDSTIRLDNTYDCC